MDSVNPVAEAAARTWIDEPLAMTRLSGAV